MYREEEVCVQWVGGGGHIWHATPYNDTIRVRIADRVRVMVWVSVSGKDKDNEKETDY